MFIPIHNNAFSLTRKAFDIRKKAFVKTVGMPFFVTRTIYTSIVEKSYVDIFIDKKEVA